MPRIAPSSEYLLRLDQPAMNTDNSVAAPTAKKKSSPASRSIGTMLRPIGQHRKSQQHRNEQHDRREEVDDLIRGARDDVFLGQHLDSVGDDCKKPNGPTRFGPRRFWIRPEAFAFEDRGDARTASGNTIRIGSNREENRKPSGWQTCDATNAEHPVLEIHIDRAARSIDARLL